METLYLHYLNVYNKTCLGDNVPIKELDLKKALAASMAISAVRAVKSPLTLPEFSAYLASALKAD